MTFAELLEEVLENISLHPKGNTVQRGDIKRLMNLAMREISLRVGIPTLYVDVPNSGTTTGSFTLPVRFHPEGIKRVELVEVADSDIGWEWVKNQEIPIMSVATANDLYGSWENDDDAPYCGPPFLVYSPANPDAGFRPVGFNEASYRFLVHAVPVDMSADSDEPFAVLDYCEDPPVRRSGAMPAYHRILAHHATYEVLQRLGDERWQAFYARYRDMQMEMYSQVEPVTVYLPGRSGAWRGLDG